MQKFRLIKLLFIYAIFAILPFSVQSQSIKLSKVVGKLGSPWAMTFINKFEVLITEKAGNIILFNLVSGSQQNIPSRSNQPYQLGKSQVPHPTRKCSLCETILL